MTIALNRRGLTAWRSRETRYAVAVTRSRPSLTPASAGGEAPRARADRRGAGTGRNPRDRRSSPAAGPARARRAGPGRRRRSHRQRAHGHGAQNLGHAAGQPGRAGGTGASHTAPRHPGGPRRPGPAPAGACPAPPVGHRQGRGPRGAPGGRGSAGGRRDRAGGQGPAGPRGPPGPVVRDRPEQPDRGRPRGTAATSSDPDPPGVGRERRCPRPRWCAPSTGWPSCRS